MCKHWQAILDDQSFFRYLFDREFGIPKNLRYNWKERCMLAHRKLTRIRKCYEGKRRAKAPRGGGGGVVGGGRGGFASPRGAQHYLASSSSPEDSIGFIKGQHYHRKEGDPGPSETFCWKELTWAGNPFFLLFFFFLSFSSFPCVSFSVPSFLFFWHLSTYLS